MTRPAHPQNLPEILTTMTMTKTIIQMKKTTPLALTAVMH
jgi:hypothetical protein